MGIERKYNVYCSIVFCLLYNILYVTLNKENTAKRKGSLWNFFVHL